MVGHLKLTKSVLALMLTAVAAATVNAQIVATPQPLPQGYCIGGPFSLTAGWARFHLALDDALPAPPMKVTLRLYDAGGSLVTSRTVTALPARSATTLELHGAGLFYAQANFDSILNPSDRRDVSASVELFDVDGFRAVIPVKCLPDERID
jgi:hypothetical protein